MMLWLSILCAILAAVVAALLIKIAILHKAADEISQGMTKRLEQDTNTLISVSTRDRTMCKLADRINKELRILRKERRRFQRGDQELKEAITNISHDLRTPLTAICGYLELLDKEEKSENAARYLLLIENRTAVLKQLTEELFRYSIIKSTPTDMSFENVSLNRVLEESIAAYYAALKERGITPNIQMPEKKVFRQLNRAALSRVFANLINNALKYSDGDLEVSLSETGEITFTNSASGLNEVQVGKLFDRFYTVETARKSTGLGLTIARTLTEQMNGTITVQYKEKKMSICIVFPDAVPGSTEKNTNRNKPPI
ncbi:MAG: HAMP domain-containing histidine kinase [Lachnospiraceae bacterium]|nr:HAMP domain-containing histidine kinase [Lachnospiraceae bacterium]